MSLWSVVRCNWCGATSLPMETDSAADFQAQSAGWKIAVPNPKAKPGDTRRGAVVDFCPSCSEVKGET